MNEQINPVDGGGSEADAAMIAALKTLGNEINGMADEDDGWPPTNEDPQNEIVFDPDRPTELAGRLG